MNNIIISSNYLKITEINKDTKATFFRDLEVDDLIKLSLEIKNVGKGLRNYVKITNVKNNEIAYRTINQLSNILQCFSFVELLQSSEIDENKEDIYLCRRCGRKLKSETSKKLGLGPICYEKMISEDNHKPLFTINKD